jgi:oxaloacetate decarboxylase gamma subunit
MLGQSGILTLLGMGVVFGFLVILIVCVSLVGKFIRALGGGTDVTAPLQAGIPSGTGAGNAAVTAAISAAVNEYRKTTNP